RLAQALNAHELGQDILLGEALLEDLVGPRKAKAVTSDSGFHGRGAVWVRRPGRVSKTRQTRTSPAIARERCRARSARDRPWPLRGRGAPGAPTRASEASGSAVERSCRQPAACTGPEPEGWLVSRGAVSPSPAGRSGR